MSDQTNPVRESKRSVSSNVLIGLLLFIMPFSILINIFIVGQLSAIVLTVIQNGYSPHFQYKIAFFGFCIILSMLLMLTPLYIQSKKKKTVLNNQP